MICDNLSEDISTDSQPKSDEVKKTALQRLQKNELRKRKRLADLGIDYDFPGYSALQMAPISDPEHTKVQRVEEAEVPAGTPKPKKVPTHPAGGAGKVKGPISASKLRPGTSTSATVTKVATPAPERAAPATEAKAAAERQMSKTPTAAKPSKRPFNSAR